jgi:hypothetical protein
MPESSKNQRFVLAVLSLLGIAGFVAAGNWALAAFTSPQNPSTGIPYEGYLEKDGGTVDGPRDFEVAMYNVASGGAALYTASWGTVGSDFNLPDLRGRFLRGRDGGVVPARDP